MAHVVLNKGAYLFAQLAIYFTVVDSSDPSSEGCDNFTLSGCSCDFLGQIYGITCNNEADMSKLEDSLVSELGENHTYEIALQNFTSIPSHVIQRLKVFRLVVDSYDTSDVSQRAFDGVIALNWFHVYASSLTRVPRFSGIAQSLTQIKIDNSRITEVMEEFQNLPLLTRLSLRNNLIKFVHPDVFKGTTAIEILDLSYNRIPSLPENVFQYVKVITKIDVSHNQLYTVHGWLKNVCPKLTYLFLEFNNLTDADDILCDKMPLLRHLSLNNNPLDKLSVNTFNKKVPNLVFLYLSHCNFTEFRAEDFKELPSLKLLELSFNQIKHVSNETVEFGSNLNIVLDGNQMESFAGRISSRTRSLFMRDNKLQSLGIMLRHTQLFIINISRNRLVGLEKTDFSGASGTYHLVFRDNEIENIDVQCFDTFREYLHTLDLSGNRITNLNRSVQSLYVLRTLDVSNNLLVALDYTEFMGLANLTELMIHNNGIVALSGDVLNFPNLEYLNLQNNSINKLDMQQFPGTLQCLYIKENPLSCNCQLYLLFLKKLQKGVPELDVIPCTRTNTLEDLPYQQCPGPCSCNCESGFNNSFVNVDCSSRLLTTVPPGLSKFSSPPSPEEGVYRIDDPNYTIEDRMLSLDLSKNSIESLNEVHFLQVLKKLYLSNNLLTTLPYSIVDLPELQVVTLSGNQWTCDCDNGKVIQFRNWLLPKDRHVPDINDTLCHKTAKNKALVSASESELCPSKAGIYVISVFSVIGFVALIVAVKLMYTRNHFTIKAWLYSKGVTFVKEKDIAEDGQFDAFIAFSDLDRQLVNENIVKQIKAWCPNIQLKIPNEGYYLQNDNDWREDMINSKRTILILTKNFLEDEGCVTNFQPTHHECSRVIVLKVRYLDTKPTDTGIQVFLDKSVCLTWGEKYFWQKFIYVLPRSVEGATGLSNQKNEEDPLLPVHSVNQAV